MRFLVVLELRPAIGSIYSAGINHGIVHDGLISHPVLDCTEIRTDASYYLCVKREISRSKKETQSLYIPHSDEEAIHVYSDDGPKPFGFIPVDE
jgi:hypothetical protein